MSKPSIVSRSGDFDVMALEEARARADALYADLIEAKNAWQYAVTNQEEAYRDVLRVKADYAKWRTLAERLAQGQPVNDDDVEPEGVDIKTRLSAALGRLAVWS